jgi:hypothetical protein
MKRHLMAIDIRRVRPNAGDARAAPPALELPLGDERRGRRRIRHLRLRSVVRFAAVFYASLYVLFLLAGLFLWALGSVTGTVAGLEHTLSDLSSSGSFSFAAGQVLGLYGLALGMVVGFAFVATVVLAAVFNLVSDVAGGFEVTMEDVGRGAPGRP